MTGFQRTTFAATTALVGLALTATPLVLADGGRAVAQEAAAAASTQAAQAVGTYHMPRGDFTSGVVRPPEERSVVPLRTPMPTDELLRLKGRAAAERAASSAIEVPPAAQSRALFRECVTNVATGSAPSDIHGATTPTNLVVVTNVDIGVYNKTTCGIVSRVSLRTFFGAFGIPATQTLFDPRALYDRLNGRCLVLAESRDDTNTNQFLYIAGSTSSSCTSWNLRRLTLSQVSTGALFCKLQQNDFYDYPNAGYNIRRLVVTSNNFTSRTGPFSNGTVLSFNTPALYANGAVLAACFNTGATGNLTPARVGDGNTSMFILSPGTTTISRRRLNAVLLDDPSSDTLAVTANITVANAPVPPDAAQPNGQRLDTVDGRFVHATKQIGTSIWAVRSINVGGFSRFRLYRLSTTGTTALFTFTPTTSTCANGDHLFNASVDTNSTASGTLAFVTATRTCPSQAVAGRAAHLIFRGPNSGAAGWVFNTVETSAAQFASTGLGTSCNAALNRLACRWGDYSSTQIDPSNTARAWGFNQLVTGTTQFDWNTRGGLVGP
jgi:hypothetical protein